MGITEKVAYIKGLLEGLSIDDTKPENKLLKAVIDVLGDIADEVNGLKVDSERIEDYLDELDHDLGELETDYYELDDDDDDDDIFDCCGEDCDCDDCCDCDYDDEEEEDDEEDK